MRDLLLGGYEPDELKARAVSGATGDVWRYLVGRWEGVASRCREEGAFFGQGTLGWHSVTPMVVEAATIYRIEGREDARDYALDAIRHFLKVAEDHRKGRPPVLSHGEVALASGILGEALPVEERAAVSALMRSLCIPFHDFSKSLAGHGSGGNIPLCQNINAATCALAWGEACGYPEWEVIVDQACDVVRQYLRNGSDEQGFSYEGTGYGAEVCRVIFRFCHILRRVGWHDDLLRDEPRLRKLPDAYAQMIMPAGNYAATTNDAGNRSPYSLWWLLLTGSEWDRPHDWAMWRHYSGPEHPIRPWGDTWSAYCRRAALDPRAMEAGDDTLLMTFLNLDERALESRMESSPLPPAVCSEGTGTATFRTSWNRGATFAAILGGGRSRACFGHAHADCGHIDIALGDEYLAIDTGRYNTNEDQHSLVLIDGKNRHPSSSPGGGMCWDKLSGRLEDWKHHSLLDYCVADASLMKGVPWALRHFLFVRTGGERAYVVCFDNINVDHGQSPRDYWWQLQCATGSKVEIGEDARATVWSGSGRARLDCGFFQKPEDEGAGPFGPIEMRQDMREWVWPYGRDQDPAVVSVFEKTGESVSSFRHPRLLAIQRGLSCGLLSVISPRWKEEPPLRLRQVEVHNGLGVEIAGEDFVDTVLVAPDHRMIFHEGRKCFSEIALCRQDPKGKRIDQWTSSGEDFRPIGYPVPH